jgi:hypothetical protein
MNFKVNYTEMKITTLIEKILLNIRLSILV